MSEAKEIVTVGNFQLTFPTPNNGQISVSAYLYSDDTDASLNERLDGFVKVVERQRRKMEIPMLETALEGRSKGCEELERQVKMLHDKKRGHKLSTQDNDKLGVLEENVRKLKEDIEKGYAELEKRRKEV